MSSLANNGGTKYWQVDANGIDAQGCVLSDIDTSRPSGTVQASDYSYFSGVPNLQARSSTVARCE